MSSQRLSADARREQILDVAIDVFGRAGYHSTSMNDIADAAGVTKPVLYQHFDSKDQLYLALLEEVGNRMRTAIVEAQTEAKDGRELTELGFRAYFRWVSERPDEFSLLFGGSARTNADFGDHLADLTDEIARLVAPLIDVDLAAERRVTLAHALMGMAEAASRHLLNVDPGFDPDSVASDISRLAWSGLRTADRLD